MVSIVREVFATYGCVYTGPTEYLTGHILGRLKQPAKKKSLKNCVHSGPVSQVHDMRRVRMVPNLL